MERVSWIGAAILPVALTVSLSGCGAQDHSDADLKALMATSRAWSKSVESGDVKKIVNFWTDDAVVMMPNEPERRGKSEITPYVQQSLKTPGFSISWEPIEGSISKSGDIGYLIERDKVTFPDGHGNIVHRIGRGVTVWKKQADGSWKDALDISQATSETVQQH